MARAGLQHTAGICSEGESSGALTDAPGMREHSLEADAPRAEPQEDIHAGTVMPPASSSSGQYAVPDRMLDKAALCIDVVTGDCHSANCFTKAYGHYIKGAGSVLATRNLHVLDSFGDWGHREVRRFVCIARYAVLGVFIARCAFCLCVNIKDLVS